jgi:hypothetical protein
LSFTQGTKNINLLLIFLLNSSNFTLLNFKNFIHSNGGSIIAYPSLLKLTQDLMIHTQCIVESNREANETQQHMIQQCDFFIDEEYIYTRPKGTIEERACSGET